MDVCYDVPQPPPCVVTTNVIVADLDDRCLRFGGFVVPYVTARYPVGTMLVLVDPTLLREGFE